MKMWDHNNFFTSSRRIHFLVSSSFGVKSYVISTYLWSVIEIWTNKTLAEREELKFDKTDGASAFESDLLSHSFLK